MTTTTNRRWYPRGAWLWVPAVLFVALGAIALWQVPFLLLNHWVDPANVDEQRKLLGTAAQIVLLALGGIIAVIGVALSLARHGQELQSADRDRGRQEFEQQKEADRHSEFEKQHGFESAREVQRIREADLQRSADEERELRARFVTAVDLLGAAETIKRIAGLYALAAVADAWASKDRAEEVQVCIDVLCGYVRSGAPAAPDARVSEADVRRTAFDLIRTHLTPGGASWSGRRFSLTKSQLWYEADLRGIQCGDTTIIDLGGSALLDGAVLRLQGAQLYGSAAILLDATRLNSGSSVRMLGVTIRDESKLSLNRCVVEAGSHLALNDLDVSGTGQADLGNLLVEADGTVMMSSIRLHGEAWLRAQLLKVRGGAHFLMDRAVLQDTARLVMSHVVVADRSTVSLADAVIEGGELTLDGAQVAMNARVSLIGTQVLSPAHVNFEHLATHSGGAVYLANAILDAQTVTLPSGRTVPEVRTQMEPDARLGTDGLG